jgi:threonine dehydratase
MQVTANPTSVKVVGANGQISLGKQFAGRQVLVEEREAGVWLVRTAMVVPDNERWLHEPTAAAAMAKAMAWADKNSPSDSAVDNILSDLSSDK